MTKRILVAASLVLALAAGSAAALAQGPGGPRGPFAPGARIGHGMRSPLANLGLRGLDLSEAQREQVRSIMQSHRAELDAARDALRAAHQAFAEAVRSGDEAAIRTRSTALATAMAERGLLQAKVRSEVHALLTPEQQQQLQEREAQRAKRLQQRQQRLQQRQRQPQ